MDIYTIYKATNISNNKVYIGFTAHWPQRIKGHDYDRRSGNAENKAFYNAIAKYGWDNFVWEAIYQSPEFEHTLKVMEPHFITEYRSWVGLKDCNGYNVTIGGEGVRGYKRTPEVIEAHRNKMKGRKFTTEHIANMKKTRAEKIAEDPTYCKWNLGKKMPPEFGQAISDRSKGVPKSIEHIANMRFRPQDTTVLTCPHCSKTGDYKNMKRWHMDNCKHNPCKIIQPPKIVTCEICGYVASQSPNFYRNHNQHCKKD